MKFSIKDFFSKWTKSAGNKRTSKYKEKMSHCYCESKHIYFNSSASSALSFFGVRKKHIRYLKMMFSLPKISITLLWLLNELLLITWTALMKNKLITTLILEENVNYVKISFKYPPHRWFRFVTYQWPLILLSISSQFVTSSVHLHVFEKNKKNVYLYMYIILVSF